MSRRAPLPSLLFGALALVTAVATPARLAAQGDDELARRAFFAGRAAALAGNADSALSAYANARALAERAGEQTLLAAALRGAAQVHAVYIGCGDSATILFREAVARSGEGDRQSADAFVRYLATRGNTAEAQQVLTAAYANAEGLGRTITRESMTWHQGTAAIQRASGREAAALTSYNQALAVAARLRTGDVSDSVATPTGEVDPVNYWIMYDLAQLRINAKAPSVKNVAAGRKILDALVNVGIGLDEQDEQVVPAARLFDTLVLRAHQCAMNTSSNTAAKCTPPTLARCTTSGRLHPQPFSRP